MTAPFSGSCIHVSEPQYSTSLSYFLPVVLCRDTDLALGHLDYMAARP